MVLGQYEKLKQNVEFLQNKLANFGCSIENLLQNKNIELIDIEDNIVLWKAKDKGYFYTDLDLNQLFGCYFDFATAFSNGQAIICFNEKNSIIDINNLTITEIPSEIDFDNCSKKIVHGNLAVFDKAKGKWGSIRYDQSEGIYLSDIPFIWDRLEFSRYEHFVYGGFNTTLGNTISNSLSANYNSVDLDRFDEFNYLNDIECKNDYVSCYTQVYRFHKKNFYNTRDFNMAIECLRRINPHIMEQKCVIGRVHSPHDKLGEKLKDELALPCDIRDQYFDENISPDYGYIPPKVLENDIDNYKLVRGKYNN